jgi:aerobic-type carbon monoxide dehydrogenase small subunit (CoxS/CutS family)
MGVFVLTVNGSERLVEAPADETLLSVLRNRLDLTGTKYGCGEGQCGACTVLIEGLPALSCRVELSAAAGKAVTTIEGLERNGRLHPVQEAFLQEEAFQCGYCTPGMVLAAIGLLGRNPNPTPDQIARSLDGNLCRCGSHSRIVAAVERAARSMRGAP